MSISQNFPAISPSLSLNFARSRTLDPRITFSRTSTATRVNGQGLIEVMSADEPRFDHKYENGVVKSLGLLIEEKRENLVTNNEDLSQWTPNAGGIVTSNDTVSPDGNTTADKVTQTNQIYSGVATEMSGITTNTVYSCSVFIKPDGDTRTRFGFYDTASWQGYLDTNWSSGEPSTNLTNSSDIVYEEYPNGWYRASFKASTQSNAFAGGIFFHCHPDRTGTGKSAWFWGAQLEKGSFPTSYIPNDTGSQKTRNPDNVSITGTNFTDWYNQDEGTVYADTRMVGVQTGRYDKLWGITNSNFNFEGISIYVAGPVGFQGQYVSSVTITNSATEEVSGTSDVSAITTPKLKSAFAFKQNNCASGYNGNLKFVDDTVGLSSFTTPPDRLLIGQPQRFQGYSCMTVSQLTYYPKRLSNTQLQNLTK